VLIMLSRYPLRVVVAASIVVASGATT
jgi:hypothetical protein